MDAFAHILTAAGILFSPGNISLLLASLISGMIVGAIPGLTSTVAIGLLIPFTFAMSKDSAFIMLLAIYCGSMFGGSIPAILMNLPGTPSAFITAIEGHPMTKRGEGPEAIAAAVISSTLGGLGSCIFLVFLSLQLAQIALAFAGPEYATLCLFALAVVLSLTSKSIVKGTISVGLGLLLSTVGVDPTVGVPRFTFGITEILIGIPTIPATIALFCVAEGFRMIERPGNFSAFQGKVQGGMGLAVRQVRRLWRTIVKSTIIGTFIGLLPGTGAVMSSLIAYGEAKRVSKEKDQFGHGVMEGVSASEAANNATTGGALIPMLTLGIPGDVNTLMLMGAMLIHGLIPGPQLFGDQADLVYVIFGTMIVANLLILPIGVRMAPFIARIALLDNRYVVPVILVLAISGPAISYGHIYYFWVSVIAGFFGYLCHKADVPVLGIAMGLILGPILETNFRSALMLSNEGYLIFVTRPISLGFLVASVIILAYGLRRSFAARVAQRAALDAGSP